MSDLSGQYIGRYHILEQLGQGGMAVVYKAYDTRLEREAAVKVIRMQSFAPDVVEHMRKRFEREAKSLARLEHPNIVPIYDYGEFEGSPYLVMRFINGGTLKHQTGRPMPYSNAAHLLAPMARALAYAHSQNVIHRDVKPANILITSGGEPMLSDFGVAKILESEEGNTLTGTGVGIGTPEYMAPEQWENKVSPQTDIYALGVVFYEMVTGRKPYTADTPAAVYKMQLMDPLPRPRTFVPGLPEQVEWILFKSLAKKPEDRYATMDEMAAALEKLASKVDTPPVQVRTPPVMATTAPHVRDEITRDQLVEPQAGKSAQKKGGLPWVWIGVGAAVFLTLGILLTVVGMWAAGQALAKPAPAAVVIPTAAPTDTPAAVRAAPTDVSALSAPAAGKIPVGIVLPSKDEPRWIQDQTSFQNALNASGYDVQVLFSQNDIAREKANVESLISQGIKVLILCPQDATAAAAAADEAAAAGVKVISYDRLIRDTKNVDYYVTFDSLTVGRIQAQYLVDHAKGKGEPLYLYAGAASDNNAFLFFEGSWEVLQPRVADGTFVIKNSSEAVGLQVNPTLTWDQESRIIGQVTTNWDYNTAGNLAKSNLAQAAARDKGNVAILAPNDGTARAIADVFAADRDVKSYVVTGQDAEKASVQYIIDGKQSMTVFKDTRVLARDAITAAEAFLTGSTPEQTSSYNNGAVDVPAKPSVVIPVDKSSIKPALIDSGQFKFTDFSGLSAAAPASPATTAGLKVGLVTDVGGVNDRSFNQSAWQGVQKAARDFGFQARFIESKQPTDYEKNIDQFATEKYDVIITVGFLMGDATAAKAKQYPNIKFAIIDNAYYPSKGVAYCDETKKDCYADGGLINVASLMFEEDQVGYLAGVLAGGMTKNGTVCTVSGMQIPPVERYVIGFQAGAKSVRADITALNVYVPSFTDPATGKETGVTMISQGCDVIFGVGSNTGNGGLLAAKEANLMAIGVDVDQYITYSEVRSALISSAMKNVDAAVYNYLGSVKGKSDRAGIFTANIQNGGVGLAPYHDWDSRIPGTVKAAVQKAILGLKNGSITIDLSMIK